MVGQRGFQDVVKEGIMKKFVREVACKIVESEEGQALDDERVEYLE